MNLQKLEESGEFKGLIKRVMLSLLDTDLEVQKKVAEVKIAPKSDGVRRVFGSAIDETNLKCENEKLKRKVEELQSQCDELKSYNASLSAKHDKLVEKLDDCSLRFNDLGNTIQKYATDLKDKNSQIEKLKAEMNSLDVKYQKYDTLEELYVRYLSLDETIRYGLENSISYEDVYQFLVSTSQWESIQSLWKYIKFQLDDISKNDLSILVDTFNWFFTQYNQLKNTYSLLSVEVGETFDGDYHAKSSNSKSLGNISEVLLLGYKNNITGNVVEKSVVRV